MLPLDRPLSVKVQLVPVTVAAPTSVPLRKTRTCSVPLSAALRVPWSSGVSSLVLPLLGMSPETGSALSMMRLKVTVWVGALVSTVTL